MHQNVYGSNRLGTLARQILAVGWMLLNVLALVFNVYISYIICQTSGCGLAA